MDAYLKI